MTKSLHNSCRFLLRRILAAASAALAWLLGVSCNIGDWGVTPVYGVAEYGMPYASYRVMGTVRARGSLEPLPGIKLTISDTATVSSRTLDSAFTDTLGRYVLAYSDDPWAGVWRVTARDVDGAANGAFLAKDTTARIPQGELTGGGGSWDAGHGEDTVDIELGRDST